MIILALEFSSDERSVALYRAGADGSQLSVEVIETGGRSTRAVGMIEQALRQTGIEREQIGCIAVGLGPGSYTGIRAAIAVAQGWQLARAVQACGISSADCVAAAARDAGVQNEFGVVIDAQRNEFYLGTYKPGDVSSSPVTPLRLITEKELSTFGASDLKLIGPELTRWLPEAKSVFPRASTLARLASLRTEFVSAEKLEPIYLRETTFVKSPTRIQPK
jgi:tRNA threonylcarbamoyl adenosine modification protein YeaZ